MLGLRDVYYFIIHLPGRSFKSYFIAFFLAENGAAEWRFVRDFSVRGVRLFRADYLIGLIAALARFLDHYPRAHLNPLAAAAGNYFRGLEDGFHFRNALFE